MNISSNNQVLDPDHPDEKQTAPTGRLLERTARQLAATHQEVAAQKTTTRLAQRLPFLAEWLQEAHTRFASHNAEEPLPSYAAEWMLDNFYIVERALRQVTQDLPDSYYTQLPKLRAPEARVSDTAMQGLPRVYALAHAYLRHEDYNVEAERLRRFVTAYQEVTPLTMGEIWALPIMLRLALIESLACATGRLVHLFEQLPEFSIPTTATLNDEEVVAHAIPSLRALDSQNWPEFFEEVNLTHSVLCTDPAHIYANMDFATRDHYRGVVEQLALATKMDELSVAQQALHLAQNACQQQGITNGTVEPDCKRVAQGEPGQVHADGETLGDELPRTCHVGYYLVDAGAAQLEAAIHYRPQGMAWIRRWLLHHPTSIYLGGVALLTLLILALVLWYAAVAGGGILMLVIVALVAIIPASTAAINLFNGILTRILQPRILPKLDFSEGVPARYRTMVVVPTLLSHLHDVESLCQQLELHYLRSADSHPMADGEHKLGSHLTFALLTDFSDAPNEVMPEDKELIDAVTATIEALNAQYPNHPFYLFHRRRLWNEGEGVWMGWERKRGKLQEFNHLLRGDKTTTYTVQVGDPEILPAIRYIITLDADTVLPRGEAQRLIGTLAHPLNHAEFNKKGKVVAGYTILQPRTEIKPTSSNKSLYSRVFGGDTGFDLYTRAVSDIYQDLFGEGIFVGKGIYDVDAFEHSLEGRAPENSILSHDLFEGIHGRAGLVTDVVLYEDYPPHYLVNVLRSHRWVRGDWQLLPWLFARVPYQDPQQGLTKIPNDLRLIDRWKIFDNLRRSLFSPMLLTFLIIGWTLLPGAPWVWTLLAILAPSMPLITALVSGMVRLAQGDDAYTVLQDIRNHALRWLLFIAFLPYEALLLLDAIASTLVRLFITRRQLLQWVTAAHTVRLFGDETSAVSTLSKMLPSLFLVVALIFLIIWVNHTHLAVAAPFLAVWLLAWWVAHLISTPEERAPAPLSPTQRQTMRVLARRTWLFYEHFVGPEDNWLPPDHFQESPRGVVAHRTSPTNTGMYLLAALAAHDLGYIGVMNLAARLRATFDTLERLDRYRGHFLNWIDTRTLGPLPPRYVSTVDSGNLAGALIVIKQGCLEAQQEAVWSWQRWQGLLDLLPTLADMMTSVVGRRDNPLAQHLAEIERKVLAVRHTPARWYPLLQELNNSARQMINEQMMVTLKEFAGEEHTEESKVEARNASMLQSCRIYSERIYHHLEDMQRDVLTLLPWVGLFHQPPELFARPTVSPAVHERWSELQKRLSVTMRLCDVAAGGASAQQQLAKLDATLETVGNEEAELAAAARDWCKRLQSALDESSDAATALEEQYAHLARAAEEFLVAMDFGFLFNKHRQVFHIGYNIESGELDNNFYDLLASEARIASLVAIAKRDVPQSHWLHLGRPLTRLRNGQRLLLSWSGTMFEYLMPPLLLRSYRNTLLDESCRASVERQIDEGHKQKTPWGISESGFYIFDSAMNYQYRAFGAPGLGFKRGLEEDQVIAPYASLLAVAYQPQAVWHNVEALRELGMMGRYGLYEAIDFTTSRLNLGQDHAIVRSYMAHHQGMILLALLNYLQKERMVNRFHAEPRIQSVDLLLQEGLPVHAPLQFPHEQEGEAVPLESAAVPINPWRVPVESPMPLVHFLANGQYGLLISNSGAGYSQRESVQLTRWRPDSTLDDWGYWLYIQEMDNDSNERRLWSAARQPTGVRSGQEEVIFHPHMAEFRRRDRGITLHMELTVAPNDNVEIRRINLTNDTERPRRLRLTSYGEVVLGPGAADERHQAFAKLFVESEYLADTNTLLFHRRPRAADEQTHFLAHSLLIESDQPATHAYESDRARFIGRGQTVRQPRALMGEGEWLTGTTGATLDPIMALGQEIELEPHASVRVALLVATAESRQETLTLVARYRGWGVLDRAFQGARNTAYSELRELGLTESRLEMVQKLLSLLLYPHPFRRAGAEILVANRKGQSGLWAYGISGDYPILLVQIREESEGELLFEVLRAHRYWRRRGLQIDVVILNRQASSYGQPVQSFVQRVISRTESNQWLNQRGGLFLLREDQLNEADRILLQTTARVVLDSAKGDLAEQLDGLLTQPPHLPFFEPTVEIMAEGASAPQEPVTPRPDDLQFDNGFGGFSPDGHEYLIYLRPGAMTPAPWINVIANADFGCLVSEVGSGYTWSINSGENRLTTWRNDPVSDQPAEVLYLRDEQSAEVWTPTPQPAPAAAPYLVRHGAGYSVFEHQSHGLRQFVHIFVAPDAPVKVIHLRLENETQQPRRLTATYYAEWVLGVNRSQSGQYIVPEYEKEICALLARNTYSADFSRRVAFVAGSKEPHGVTTDRTEFLGRLGTLAHPAALERIGLSGRVQAGPDPCAALQLHLDLAPESVQEIYFLVGQGANREEAVALAERFKANDTVEETWRAARQQWDEILGRVTVETPEPAMNLLLNRWLLYQALSCRIWGRSALYQSSGAYGFRDQLQDVMALVHARPDLMRAQILRAARHQFEAGDVLHWWHPPAGQGVRTRITDDLLWLPYVTAHYVAVTGDETILQEEVPFLEGKPLAAEEEERYAHYDATEKPYTLLEHCRRALRKGTTAGRHGIPLMGAGDWNDGMNRVGIEGKGESIWLGWFLHATLTNFAALCDRIGEDAQAEQWRKRASEIQQALEENGWDGAWYRRAYYDDGTPLGSTQNLECRIDSIAQSWAVLSSAADPARARQAMQSVLEQLVRWDDRLILLFTPPFNQTNKDPGYIKGYLPGIRENGGQYTHAALWTIWAFAQLGDGDTAGKLFTLINPILRADTRAKAEHYVVEPYVIAADVYGVAPHQGRGGWTWYTGSSGWMYRLGIEAILGLQRVAAGLRIVPRLPSDWPGFKATYRFGQTTYHIAVEKGAADTAGAITLDGNAVADDLIPLHDDGQEHQVRVQLGESRR
ncbi:MAG: glucoamylase family protein [Caldilineaceae bacterium]